MPRMVKPVRTQSGEEVEDDRVELKVVLLFHGL